MKEGIKKILQAILGFKTYLFIFSLFTIVTLKWKKDESAFLDFLELVPDDGIVLDIGANIGVMTVHFARRLQHSQVHAFEPIPQNIRTLKRIIRFFGLKNVRVHETAVGNSEGHIHMVMPVVHSVRLQGLSHVIDEDYVELNDGEKYLMPLHSLDSYDEFKNINSPVIAIKIDVEGYEYYVLDGARQLLNRHKPLVYCELWDDKKRDTCLRLMHDAGYAIWIRDKKHLVPFDRNIHHTENFFFIPEGRTL
ncbi:MAG: FkbM family methyltransferase [Bacteroidetes bacterium]|nr:FkbM family methyltransferase [Bacteroidota bacterium]